MNAKHCSETNMELFSFFSDCYKSYNGVRPRFFITEDEVNEWFSRREAENQEAEKEAQFEATIKAGTHSAFTTPESKLEYSPFAAL